MDNSRRSLQLFFAEVTQVFLRGIARLEEECKSAFAIGRSLLSLLELLVGVFSELRPEEHDDHLRLAEMCIVLRLLALHVHGGVKVLPFLDAQLYSASSIKTAR